MVHTTQFLTNLVPTCPCYYLPLCKLIKRLVNSPIGSIEALFKTHQRLCPMHTLLEDLQSPTPSSRTRSSHTPCSRTYLTGVSVSQGIPDFLCKLINRIVTSSTAVLTVVQSPGLIVVIANCSLTITKVVYHANTTRIPRIIYHTYTT